MQVNSDYAKIITAAHRGSNLAQHALEVIDDVKMTLAKSCDRHHVARLREYAETVVCENVASKLIEASPWLNAVANTQGIDIRH